MSLHAEAERSLHTLDQRARRLASMHRIVMTLSASLDRDVILNAAARLAAELFACEHCNILLIQEAGDQAAVVAEYPVVG